MEPKASVLPLHAITSGIEATLHSCLQRPDSTGKAALFGSQKVEFSGTTHAIKRCLDAAISNSASFANLTTCQASEAPGSQVVSMGGMFVTPAAQSVGMKLGPQPFPAGISHQGSFTIPAFKCLTEDDLILTDELEDGGALAAAFGELADPSHLGLLPTEEDLKLNLFDPTPPAAAPLAPAPHPSLMGPFFDPLLPTLVISTPLSLQSFPPGLQQQLVQQQFALLRAQHAQQADQDDEAQQAEQEGMLGEFEGEVDSCTPPSRSSSLGGIKRRMDAMDLEDPGSARGAKRSNSINSLLASWGESAGPNVAPAVSILHGGHDMHRTTSAPQPLSRFSLEACPSQSLSPSPAPTPVRRGERASPAKMPVRSAVERVHSAAAAFELVQQGSLAGEAAALAIFKGVSKHKLTQRWEASLWLAGRQLYLGGFDNQEDAARAYDIAALACKGEGADTNFPPGEYVEQMLEVQGLTRDEVVAYVRRRSSAFSRGKSRFRGVSGHEGRWEARIGSFQGRKNVSFGIFETEEEAARQYDRALILEKGRSAKTNFPIRDYEAEVAKYETYILSRFGGFGTQEALDIAQEYTLPTHRTATLEDKKRSALIYAEDLRQRLLWRD